MKFRCCSTAGPEQTARPTSYVGSITVPTTLRSQGHCTVRSEGLGTVSTALWRFHQAPILDVTYKVG